MRGEDSAATGNRVRQTESVEASQSNTHFARSAFDDDETVFSDASCCHGVSERSSCISRFERLLLMRHCPRVLR